MNDENNFAKAVAFVVIGICYGIAFFTSMIWVSFLPNILHGFIDLKAEVLISGIFWLAWIGSHVFLLIANSVIRFI